MHINFEFKARHQNIQAAEQLLLAHQSFSEGGLAHSPTFIGEDHQIDTYFNVPAGRLKLREGNIEQALIFYQRSNDAAAKQSDVTLYPHTAGSSLKTILTQSLGVKVVVDKHRRIYFLENVKFHFDTVQDLGNFVEVEAIDKHGSIGLEKLKAQCLHYQNLFGIRHEDMLPASYSDMLLAKKSSLR